MAGGKVPVHFKVVASEEYVAVDEERPPHRVLKVAALVMCAGAFY